MDLRSILRTFGLEVGAAQVQPDVSGFTISNLLVQTTQEPDMLLLALGALYEEVSDTRPAPGLVQVDLRRQGHLFARLVHDTRAGQRFTFTYWDTEPLVNAFLQQASGWADSNVGPLEAAQTEGDTPVWHAIGNGLEVIVSRPVTGETAEARLEMTALSGTAIQ